MEQDQYTRLRVLLSEIQADLSAKLTEHVSGLRSEIRAVASQVEHYERTSEMRFKGTQEQITKVVADVTALGAEMRAIAAATDRRVSNLERTDDRQAGEKQGGERTRQQLYAALSAIVALLAIVAFFASQGGAP